MKVLTKEEFHINKFSHLDALKDGALFIHPTDTIYGIGCDATNNDAVKKLRDAKQRPSMPFSVIAPSKEWILEHCVVPESGKKWLDKLPGAYTLIFKTKNDCVASEVNNNSETLGVRIPAHWVSDVVAEFGRPFVTTSANVAGRQPMAQLEDLHEPLKKATDFVVYEGKKAGRPSTIIDLTDGEKVVER